MNRRVALQPHRPSSPFSSAYALPLTSSASGRLGISVSGADGRGASARDRPVDPLLAVTPPELYPRVPHHRARKRRGVALLTRYLVAHGLAVFCFDAQYAASY